MELTVKTSNLSGDIRIPSSKSHTIRGFIIASLARGRSILKNPLISADTLSCIEGVQAMGAQVISGHEYTVEGFNKVPIPPQHPIDMGNSGTSLRMLTTVAALAGEPIAFDGDESLRKRPMDALFNALQHLGATINSPSGFSCPFSVKGPLKGGKTNIQGISSQFLSSLLLCAPLLQEETEIHVENLHERPYVQMTLDWLEKQQIRFDHQGLDWFLIKGGQSYQPFEENILGDFSSATFPLCAAAITGSEIKLRGLDFSDSQGDKEVFKHLEQMGTTVTPTDDGVLIKGNKLEGIEIDMNNIPDALPALAVVGCFAKGRTKLFNVPQARLKECDRIKAMYRELTKMGGNIEELEDGLIIRPSPLKGTHVHGYHDHRIVMALAIAGMAAEGETTVDTAESINVTYPTFQKDFQQLNADVHTT